MAIRSEELRYKEVICLSDGSRLGYVGDMELDLEQGHILALIVPGRRRLFGLLGRVGGFGYRRAAKNQREHQGHCKYHSFH